MARRDTQEEAAHPTDEESHIPDSAGVTNAEGLSLESHIHYGLYPWRLVFMSTVVEQSLQRLET